MKRIFLDIDDVCADFVPHFLEHFNLPKHLPTHWEDIRFRENIHKVYNNDAFWRSVPPIFNPLEYDLSTVQGYCTARVCRKEVIEEWLHKHNFPDKKILTPGPDKSKVDMLRENQCDIFLDDAIHNFVELNNNGILTYLIDRSHNIGFDAKELRVKTFEEFLRIVNNDK